ncbi:MAG: TRAP transporter small permease [Pseudomonadota bacterium]
MVKNKPNAIYRTITVLQKIEDAILSGLLLVMIFMAVTQIFLRNLFDSGILWADALIRVLVLWIGLIGAMIASRDNHHISIDVISRYLPERTKQFTTFITSVFTALVCGIMSWFSLSFVLMEKLDGLTAFAAVPAWVCESIIPVSFAIICLRYLVMSVTLLITIIKRS